MLKNIEISPPKIFHHDPCDIQPPSTLLFTKIIFVLLLKPGRSGCWTLMLTLPFEWDPPWPPPTTVNNQNFPRIFDCEAID